MKAEAVAEADEAKAGVGAEPKMNSGKWPLAFQFSGREKKSLFVDVGKQGYRFAVASLLLLFSTLPRPLDAGKGCVIIGLAVGKAAH